MPFQFRKASSVVVATLNMYILRPDWLAARGIIPNDTLVEIQTNLSRPGFRLRFPKLSAEWHVTPERIAVQTQDPAVDCGSVVAKVLEALPETPIHAQGNNVEYWQERDDGSLMSPLLQQIGHVEAEGAKPKQGTVHFAFAMDEPRVLNVQVALQAEEVELSANRHAALEGKKDAHNLAVESARKFNADRRLSVHYAETLFQITPSQ